VKSKTELAQERFGTPYVALSSWAKAEVTRAYLDQIELPEATASLRIGEHEMEIREAKRRITALETLVYDLQEENEALKVEIEGNRTR
jgi:predicted  nucleic acid-binding Zn-ribbon protein